MVNRTAMFRMARGALLLSCIVATGCASMHRERAQEPAPTTPPAAPVPVPVPAEATSPQTVTVPAAVAVTETPETAVQPPVIEPVNPPSPAPAPRAVVPRAPAASPPVAKAAAPGLPAATAPTQVPATKVVPKAATAVPVAPRPAVAPPPAAPLDFKSLGTRLRQTRAIGVMTKLSLKNEADDLLEAFRAYHSGHGKATLAELRRSYDMLLLKVLTLLQDGDPPLARDIVQSRAAIWGILSDPRKFTESNLMAGATP